MKLRILKQTPRLTELGIERDKTYEVADIIEKDYIIEVPMKRKGKFKRVLVFKEEGKLVEV